MFDRDSIVLEGRTLIVHTPDLLDISNINVLDGLEGEIDSTLPEKVLLDLSSTTFMDSAGVGVLVRLFRICHGKNIEFNLKGLTGQPLSLLSMLKVTDVIQLA